MSTLTMDIEKASIRQNVKYGYILVWKGYSDHKSNTLKYEHVVSWKIYRTKNAAREEIQRMYANMVAKYNSDPDKWSKKDMDEKTALWTVLYKDQMGIK